MLLFVHLESQQVNWRRFSLLLLPALLPTERRRLLRRYCHCPCCCCRRQFRASKLGGARRRREERRAHTDKKRAPRKKEERKKERSCFVSLFVRSYYSPLRTQNSLTSSALAAAAQKSNRTNPRPKETWDRGACLEKSTTFLAFNLKVRNGNNETIERMKHD